MSFATFTNIIVIVIGAAVLVQSVRMMRSFQAVKNGGLKEMVEALEKATSQARHVLADLKETLRTEGAANARVVSEGERMREELTVMIGIANASAERMLENVGTSNRTQQAGAPAANATPASAASPKRSRRRPAPAEAVAEVR
jgi:enamine deaminase RidA (YjgF/YER057c/UK114 family)